MAQKYDLINSVITIAIFIITHEDIVRIHGRQGSSDMACPEPGSHWNVPPSVSGPGGHHVGPGRRHAAVVQSVGAPPRPEPSSRGTAEILGAVIPSTIVACKI